MGKIFSWWIPLGLIISCLCGLMYVVAQQEIRQGANDPQIQIAEDLSRRLTAHGDVVINNRTIDIAQSLSPFIMVFDKKGTLTSSEAVLHGSVPVVPQGVFAYTLQNNQDRFTWQPDTNVRIATVVVVYNNGYILVGRSLREVEKREDALLQLVLFGWGATLGISFVAVALFLRKK